MARQQAVTGRPQGKDYGYGNARIRGMRSRLLAPTFYEQLIQTPDLARMIALLSDTEYGPDLEEEILHGRTAAQIDAALRNNIVRTYRKVLGFLDGQAAYLATTLLSRWDVFNVKTIIRGRHLGMGAAEIDSNVMPAGQFSAAELSVLSRSQDVRAVVDTLATWGVEYAGALSQAVVEYQRDGDIAALELALDRYYAQWAMRRLAKRNVNYQLAAKIVSIQIDTTNLMTAIRLQKADMEGVDPLRFFLPGGLDVDERLFAELTSMSDIDELLDGLKATPYGRPLEEEVVHFVEVGSVAVFERALEDYLMRKALRADRGDPLGVGLIIGYLWAKHNEVTNLRIIVKGTTIGMPEDRMRRELILV
jgi:V/A-type H+-transporting ATPase subunit C